MTIQPSNPELIESARGVLNYFESIYGQKSILGANLNFQSHLTYDYTGKRGALWGGVFSIDVATNNPEEKSSWTTVYTEDNFIGPSILHTITTTDLTFDTVDARYVRINMTEKRTDRVAPYHGYSLYSLEIPVTVYDDTRDLLLRGTNANDTVNGGIRNDSLNGNGGDDILRGGRGNDRLIGGRGNDLLIGGKGNDILRGGSGDNKFKYYDWREGVDKIFDFNPNRDSLVFTQSGFPGGLTRGKISPEQLLIVRSLENVTDSFRLGFIYAQRERTLAYLALEEDIELTPLVIFSNQPELNRENLRII